jgi:hypothetical protein
MRRSSSSSNVYVMLPAYIYVHSRGAQILNDITHHEIRIFQAPVYENEDEETIAENEEIAVRFYFYTTVVYCLMLRRLPEQNSLRYRWV